MTYSLWDRTKTLRRWLVAAMGASMAVGALVQFSTPGHGHLAGVASFGVALCVLYLVLDRDEAR